jgi:hypothetical protein
MTTLRISASPGSGLSFDLRELLDVLGDEGMRATWHCEVGDFVPAEGSKYLPSAYDAASAISGAILYQVASQTGQIIDGVFTATREGEAGPWVILEAVDSSWWEVTTEDQVIDAVSGNFSFVRVADQNT